jgi:hypothetical protein
VSTPAERVRTYLELPGEQLTASTPGQFCQLLSRIMTAKEVTASQVAIKARIPRSQAYNMASRSRAKLPSRPEQVRAFVEACDLAPLQVGLVMDLWAKLDQQAREQATVASSPVGKDATSDIPLNAFMNFHSDISAPSATFGASHRRRAPRSASYRPAGIIDLLFLVIEDDARTRRALRLLLPLAVATVIIVASFTTWAVLQPSHAPMIGGILAAGFLLPLSTILKHATRTRR